MMRPRTRQPPKRPEVAERYRSVGGYAEPGMSVADIARGLGVSRKAVQQVLRRAEMILREALRDLDPREEGEV
jgi:DNA-directed RNA polymerase specialized sigma24 family protein